MTRLCARKNQRPPRLAFPPYFPALSGVSRRRRNRFPVSGCSSVHCCLRRREADRKRTRGSAERMVCWVSRQGREHQRYNSSTGGRLVVGCIPYKFKINICPINNVVEALEVLVISSQKGYGMMFPKGGWESDETIKQAASREALEEAGVQGNLEQRLGKWKYKSGALSVVNESVMFPLNVTEELLQWPEKSVRQRRWVSVTEAMEGCKHPWMREALDRLVRRLSSSMHLKSVSVA